MFQKLKSLFYVGKWITVIRMLFSTVVTVSRAVLLAPGTASPLSAQLFMMALPLSVPVTSPARNPCKHRIFQDQEWRSCVCQFRLVGIQFRYNSGIVDYTHSRSTVTEQIVVVDPACVDLIGIDRGIALQLHICFHAQVIRSGSENDHTLLISHIYVQ